MRPEYEQTQDRINQGIVAAALHQAWDLADVVIYPRLAAIDFLLTHRDKDPVYCETKRRFNPSTQYPTLLISKEKIDVGMFIADAQKVRLYLAINWDDGIFWRQLTKDQVAQFKVEMGGRTDRNDAKDIESVYHIPVISFRPLEPKT